MGRALKKMWIPSLLVVVLAVSGLVVSRLHKVFASQDLNANDNHFRKSATSTSTKRRPGHGGTADQGVAGVAKRRRPQPRPVPAEGKPCSTRSTMVPSVRMGQCERDSLDVRCGAVLLQVSAMTGNGTHVGHYCGRTACSWQIS